MDLKLKNQLFIIGGASSGFGRAIATALLAEGAKIIAIARTTEKLQQLKNLSPQQVEILQLDLTQDGAIQQVSALVADRQVHGILINAGGPPAKTVMESSLQDWDEAYRNILRWKIALIQSLIPGMIKYKYGRIICIESSSVKQPLENLVLSNAIRLAVVGFIKTLSQEIAQTGITLNIMAPGSHDTAAIERIYQKKSAQTQIPVDQVRLQAISQIPVGALGNPDDFASLALWLFSSSSKYITGQTITVDGGMVKSVFG
jgi:3-oxoacyl-[acyl-carrier protein] reductase